MSGVASHLDGSRIQATPGIPALSIAVAPARNGLSPSCGGVDVRAGVVGSKSSATTTPSASSAPGHVGRAHVDVPAKVDDEQTSGTPTSVLGTHTLAFVAKVSTTVLSASSSLIGHVPHLLAMVLLLVLNVPPSPPMPPPPILPLPSLPPAPRWEDASAEAGKQADLGAPRAASLVTPPKVHFGGVLLAETAASGGGQSRVSSVILSDNVGAAIRCGEGLAVQELTSVIAHGLDLIHQRCSLSARRTAARVPDGAPLVCPGGRRGQNAGGQTKAETAVQIQSATRCCARTSRTAKETTTTTAQQTASASTRDHLLQQLWTTLMRCRLGLGAIERATTRQRGATASPRCGVPVGATSRFPPRSARPCIATTPSAASPAAGVLSECGTTCSSASGLSRQGASTPTG